MLIAVGLDMLDPVVTQKIIDDVITAGRYELFRDLLLAFLGITLGRALPWSHCAGRWELL
ncbi:MAG: ABC transporter ATP-binding protein [Firmicutes bacterium]|jgi:ABC-type bacteriocin/lantibiotic exporter with double-glycine peptidase domain|nr:ABC transporter ATP-binding protein [Bacillota bacterium]